MPLLRMATLWPTTSPTQAHRLSAAAGAQLVSLLLPACCLPAPAWCSVVVVRFDTPLNSALLAGVSDGNTVTNEVQTPPSPPATTPPAPDLFALYATEPAVYFSQVRLPSTDRQKLHVLPSQWGASDTPSSLLSSRSWTTSKCPSSSLETETL